MRFLPFWLSFRLFPGACGALPGSRSFVFRLSLCYWFAYFLGSRYGSRRLVCFFDLTPPWPTLLGGSRLFVTRRGRAIRLAPTFRYFGYLFTGRSNRFLLILLRRRIALRLFLAFGCFSVLCFSRLFYTFLILVN